MYIYYPSCNFTKLFPDTAKKIRSYLQTQPDVKIAGCCHKTFDMAEGGDIIITVCNSCMRVLEEITDDKEIISLYEFLLTRDKFPWPDLNGESITLQDCFRARGKHGLHNAVRNCMEKMNISIVEMENNRDEEDYDGSFRLHNPYPQNQKEAPKYFKDYLPNYVTPMPEEEWINEFRKHAELYTTDKVVCYCNTCTTGAKQGGANAVHLAELIFP
ncbi:MAG: hypothetical protein Q4C42_10565 [Clostridia bacterium]|nr:hypothetical protein [Clostridia bacterium]